MTTNKKYDFNTDMCCEKNNEIDNDLTQKNKENEEITSFEEALNLAGLGKYTYLILFFVIYTLLAVCLELFSLGMILTASQCDLELDVYKTGLIGSIPMLSLIISATFWGYLADTRGRKRTLMITMTGTAAAAVISSFSNHWIFMAVTKFLSAICASGSYAIIYTLLGETTPQSHRGKFLMAAATGVFMAQIFVVSLSYPVLNLSLSYYIPLLNFNYRPWRLLCQLFGLASILNITLLYWVYESPKFYFAKGEHEKGLNVLKEIYNINTGKSIDTYHAKHVDLDEDNTVNNKKNIFRSMWDQTVPLFSTKYIKKTLLICYVCITAYCVGPSFVVWLPSIFNSYSQSTYENTKFCEYIRKNESVGNNTYVENVCDDNVSEFTYQALTAFALYLTSTSAVCLIIMQYTGKKLMYIGIHLFTGLFAILINRIGGIWGIIFFIAMMSNAIAIGITTTYAVEMFPTYLRAMAVCLTMMVGRGASFIIVNILGTQLLTNCDNFLYIFAAFIFCGGAGGFFLPNDKKENKKSNVKDNDSKV